MARSKKDRARKRERWLRGYGRCMESTRFTKKLAARRTRKKGKNG